MDHVERYALLLKELGDVVHVPGLAADESGYLGLDINGGVLQLQLDRHTGKLTLFARLGTVPSGHRAAVNAHLLDANLFWQGTRGATLGADIETHEIVMAQLADIAQLDGAGLASLVEGFESTAEAWRRHLADLVAGLEAGEPLLLDHAAPTFMMIRG